MRRLAIRATALALCLSAFGAPNALAVAPTIVKTGVSKVGTDSATLQAEVNPQGKAALYHFEYGLKDCATNTCISVPDPEGLIAANTSPVSVPPFLLTGLTPGTTYHLRVVATNADDVTPGPDRVFTTHVVALNGLPDGRAYEQASPVKKNAADARDTVVWAKAADDGGAVGFLSSSGIAGGVGGQEIPSYLASRGASDWSTQGLLPPPSAGTEALVRGWLPDFSTVFDFARNFDAGQDGVLLARSSSNGSLSEIVAHGDGLNEMPSFAGASADGSKVVFEARSALSCCAAAIAGKKSNVYLWDRDSGQVSLVSLLNDESSPDSGAVAGPYDWMKSAALPLKASEGGSASRYYTQDTHVISADGDVVYFTAEDSGELYARINPTEEQSELDGGENCTEPELACTVEISATHRTPLDPLGSRPAAFMAATPDGGTTFFASPEELTDNANTGPAQLPPAIEHASTAGKPILPPTLPIKATGIAIDSKYIYWVNPDENAIGRTELDGAPSNPAFIPIPPRTECPPENSGCAPDEEEAVPANPRYVAVDAGHIYWTNERSGNKERGTIGRADIEGTPPSIEANWIEGANRPKGIAVNAEHVFWANAGRDPEEGTISQAEIDGDPVVPDFIGPAFVNEKPEGLAVDAGHIYLTSLERNGNSVNNYFRLRDLDGTNPKFRSGGTNVEYRGVAVDAGHVYWASQGEEAIGQANLDLTGVVNKFIETSGKPKGLAVNASELFWSVNGEATPNPGNDLYRYRAADESLLDITHDGPAPNGAEVKGVLGASEDAKRVYLAANGDLDGGGAAKAGNCQGKFDLFVFSGQCSLYLAEETGPDLWSTTFIAPLDASGSGEESDAANWVGKSGELQGGGLSRLQKTARISADGSVLLFRSQEQLSAYDNEGRPELYRYEVGGELSCISCNPTGEAPRGAATLGSLNLSAIEPQQAPASVLSRNLSADGNRVFFETTDALVANDTNGEAGCSMEGASGGGSFPSCQDAYEWEAQGTGSCKEDVQGGGCLYLLSTGKSPHGSFFVDASLSGDDAFIATRSAGLVLQDQDQLQDVYDARIGGGLASQNQVPPIPCESLDGCHSPATPPPGFQSPGSANFSGPGNRKVVRKKQAKKNRHKKQGQKKHHKKHKRATDTSGRSSR